MNQGRALTLGMGMLLMAAGPAPEITGGPWISSEPLSLAGLRGRVART